MEYSVRQSKVDCWTEYQGKAFQTCVERIVALSYPESVVFLVNILLDLICINPGACFPRLIHRADTTFNVLSLVATRMQCVNKCQCRSVASNAVIVA